jgi:APA family basic amino acid/polyamine antiporter
VMSRLPDRTWLRFAIWSAVGIALYFAYGYKHSLLRRENRAEGTTSTS